MDCHQSAGDVDTMIVACALQYAIQGTKVTVVANDTDVLILLMYHWKKEMADIYFSSEINKPQKNWWKVRDITSKAGNIITYYLHSCVEWV